MPVRVNNILSILTYAGLTSMVITLIQLAFYQFIGNTITEETPNIIRQILIPFRSTDYGFELILGGYIDGFPGLCTAVIKADLLEGIQVDFSSKERQVEVAWCGLAAYGDQDIKDKYKYIILDSIQNLQR